MRRQSNRMTLSLAILAVAFGFVSAQLAFSAQANTAQPKAKKTAAEKGDVSFAKEAVGSIPDGWQIAETNGKGAPAKWEIIEDASAPEGPKAIAITANGNSGETFNLLTAKKYNMRNVFVSVTLKALEGKEDQGGGVIWRCKDADNYYVARWNPLESNLRLYYVKNGKRTQIRTVENVKADPKAWHRISVRHAGSTIMVWLDGKKLIDGAKDSTLTASGMVGLWTKADGRSEFAKFRVRPPAMPVAGALKDNPMTLSELPPAVKATLDAASKGGALRDIVKVTRGEKVVRYEIDVTVDGKTREIQIGPGGELLRGLPGAATGQPKAGGGKSKTGETGKKVKD